MKNRMEYVSGARRPCQNTRKNMLQIFLISLVLLHSTSAQRQSSSNIGATDNASKQQKDDNDLKYAPSKLNSSVSFGILESDIAAIFKGVAYGVTTSYSSRNGLRNKTTVTTTSTTSTTTSTTIPPSPTTPTTTTPIPAPVTVKNPVKTLNYDRNHDEALKTFDVSNIESNSFPNDEWISNSQHDQATYYPSNEKTHTQENSNTRNIPYDFNNNNNLDENNHLRDTYESSYLHDRDSNFRTFNEEKKVLVDDVEIHQVVDYGWMIHVYLTGVLMGVVAAMAIGCIPRIHFCSPVFPRNFFVTMHILVFLAAFLRCILLFNGSFGEANSTLPKVLTGLLINSVPPCLTAAFALVLLVYLKATHLYILPTKYQSSFVLAIICIIHIVTSVIVDICAGVSDSESIISALRAGVQAITAGWGILLCLAFIYLIVNLRKNEEMRAVVPKKSLKVIYISVTVQLILACFLIYGIVSPSPAKNNNGDNTWSVWVLASVERLLEAIFCVTLVIITTTFTMSKCDATKPQEQKVFSVMTASKRDAGLGRSANVYPVTTEKGAYLANGLFNGTLEADNGNKSENYYSGWLDKYNTGTIDSITSDFQLLGKGTSTMSTMLYPPYGTIIGENCEDGAKDTYGANGQESSTSYSTLSSYRPVTGGQMCYCTPIAQCCPSTHQKGPGFAVTKPPVLLVPQYSHPQSHTSSVPQSEESTAGSSYYGSSLASSHIYSSPQYYTCPNQPVEISEIHIPNRNIPMHLHQCSEMNNIQTRLQHSVEDSRHIPSASLPILQDIHAENNNKKFLQQQHNNRPQQPLPPHHELQHQTSQDNNSSPVTLSQSSTRRIVQQAPPLPSSPHPFAPHHPQQHYLHHPHVHSQIHHVNNLPQQSPLPNRIIHQQPNSEIATASQQSIPENKNKMPSKVNKISSSTNSTNSVKNCQSSDNERLNSQRESAVSRSKAIESSSAIETIEGSDCSFLNKLVKSPEGQILSGSLELDAKRMSQRKKAAIVDQSVGLPVSPRSYRQHMALDDVDLPSQIV